MVKISAEIHDESLLEQVKALLESHGVMYNEEKNITNTYEMSDNERNAVLEGLEEIELGNIISHKEVMDETRKRYPNLFVDGNLV